MKKENLEKLLEFFNKTNNLKKTKRTGWIRNKIPQPESVADHSFNLALLALILADSYKVDKDKAVKIAIVHDLAESITGDITFEDMNEKEKYKKELKTMQELSKILKNKEILDLWLEFEQNKTKEARFVKELDKLEALIQALEYEKEHKINLEIFWKTSKSLIKSKKSRKIFEFLLNKKNSLNN